MVKNKDYRTIHIITTHTDEEYEMIQAILRENEKRIPILEAMTREERIEHFRRGLYPQDINFDMDFGSTVLHVQSKFTKNSADSIPDKVQRVSQKINS